MKKRPLRYEKRNGFSVGKLKILFSYGALGFCWLLLLTICNARCMLCYSEELKHICVPVVKYMHREVFK